MKLTGAAFPHPPPYTSYKFQQTNSRYSHLKKNSMDCDKTIVNIISISISNSSIIGGKILKT